MENCLRADKTGFGDRLICCKGLSLLPVFRHTHDRLLLRFGDAIGLRVHFKAGDVIIARCWVLEKVEWKDHLRPRTRFDLLERVWVADDDGGWTGLLFVLT